MNRKGTPECARMEVESYAGALEDAQAENARLQRVVDDLADALRKINAEGLGLFSTGDPDAALLRLAKRARNALDEHGLLRPADRPECVPEAMRAGAEE